MRDVTITGNTVAGNRAGYDGRMLGLEIKVCGDKGVREDFTVTDNTGLSTVKGVAGWPVMYFKDVRGVTVTGNRQPMTSGEFATFPGSTDVTYDG